MAEVGDDPIGAYEQSVSPAKQAATAPGAMEATCHLSFGDPSGAEYAGQLFTDLLVHGWDIAKATGQDTRLDPERASIYYEEIVPRKDSIRASGVFSTEQPVTDDADVQTKLLALLGRQAWRTLASLAIAEQPGYGALGFSQRHQLPLGVAAALYLHGALLQIARAHHQPHRHA